jgi:DNA-binding NarL/FixJ family response regulator
MKLLLVDDHALLRDGLALVMAQEFIGLQLLQAGTLAEAQALLQRDPDVRLVLLDLGLPDGHGIEAMPRLREAAPAATLVALSADERRETIMAAIGAGAAGYIPKTADAAVMLAALHVVLAGGVYLPPGMLERRAAERPGDGTWTPAPQRPEDLGFSPRQADVLRLLIDGNPNKLIARDLDMSESTVKTHLAAIFRKLDANSRTQAVMAAARLGLRLGTGRR